MSAQELNELIDSLEDFDAEWNDAKLEELCELVEVTEQ